MPVSAEQDFNSCDQSQQLNIKLCAFLRPPVMAKCLQPSAELQSSLSTAPTCLLAQPGLLNMRPGKQGDETASLPLLSSSIWINVCGMKGSVLQSVSLFILPKALLIYWQQRVGEAF